jgi:hypothetical protein
MSANLGGPSLVDRFQSALDAVEGLRDAAPQGKFGGIGPSFPSPNPKHVSFSPLGMPGALAPPPLPGGGPHYSSPYAFGPASQPAYPAPYMPGAHGSAFPPPHGPCAAGASIYGGVAPPWAHKPPTTLPYAPVGIAIPEGSEGAGQDAGTSGKGYLGGLPAPLLAAIALSLAIGIFLLRRRIASFLQGARARRNGGEVEDEIGSRSAGGTDAQPLYGGETAQSLRRRGGEARQPQQDGGYGAEDAALGHGLANTDGSLGGGAFAFQRTGGGRGGRAASGSPTWDAEEEQAMRSFMTQQENMRRKGGKGGSDGKGHAQVPQKRVGKGGGSQPAQQQPQPAPMGVARSKGRPSAPAQVPPTRKTVTFPPEGFSDDEEYGYDEEADNATRADGGPEFFADDNDPLFAKL